jgi:hypothetical protein
MAPYGSDSKLLGTIALKRHDALSIYKASAEARGLKSVRVGSDEFLTKAIAENPECTDEYVDLVQKVADAIDDRLTGGLTFTRTTVDPFAAAGIDVADYFVRRGGATYTFAIVDLFAALDRERGPGQISANTPRV